LKRVITLHAAAIDVIRVMHSEVRKYSAHKQEREGTIDAKFKVAYKFPKQDDK
jgi:hypothetical protein